MARVNERKYSAGAHIGENVTAGAGPSWPTTTSATSPGGVRPSAETLGSPLSRRAKAYGPTSSDDPDRLGRHPPDFPVLEHDLRPSPSALIDTHACTLVYFEESEVVVRGGSRTHLHHG